MTSDQPWRRWLFIGLIASFFIYSANVYTLGTPGPHNLPTADENVFRGQDLYRAYNCTACHQIYGLGGYMGPDLTNIINNPDLGPDYARLFIEEGTDRMPNFNLNSDEVDDLIAFLEYAGAAGNHIPQKGKVTLHGTVDYKRD